MKKVIVLLSVAALAALSCQPHFDMVPPGNAVVVEQEFSENWYVTKDGAGVKNGTDWNNALPFEDFLLLMSNPASSLSEAGIHIQEGVYLVSDANKFLTVSKDILCVRGGYKKGLAYDDVSECDPEKYPTVFTGDANGDGEADDGDGAFIYVTEGNLRFENITFRHFWQGSEMEGELGGKGSPVFGINGSYLATSVECVNCVFDGNVNGVAGTTSHEGGSCAFVSEGYFKARACLFKNNSAISRGGVLRTISSKAVLFLDRCMFVGNSINGSFGSVIQNSDGVVCANNCTMISNQGSGSTLNGGGAFFLSSNTIIDDSAPNGANNAAFRCESKADRKSVLINNVLSSSVSDGYGLVLNSSGTFFSKGYNVIKSIYLGSGCSDPTVKEDLKKDIILDGKREGNVWEWDIAQIEDELKGYTNADEVYDAAVGFDPSAYCGISVLGRAYATWVTPTAFSLDGRGEMRGDDTMQPGSYDPNLDE